MDIVNLTSLHRVCASEVDVEKDRSLDWSKVLAEPIQPSKHT